MVSCWQLTNQEAYALSFPFLFLSRYRLCIVHSGWLLLVSVGSPFQVFFLFMICPLDFPFGCFLSRPRLWHIFWISLWIATFHLLLTLNRALYRYLPVSPSSASGLLTSAASIHELLIYYLVWSVCTSPLKVQTIVVGMIPISPPHSGSTSDGWNLLADLTEWTWVMYFRDIPNTFFLLPRQTLYNLTLPPDSLFPHDP